MTDSARYAYAITRGLDAAAMAGATGLRSAELAVVSAGGLDAVVGDVPLEEFSEEALPQNLESLAWLEEVARGHDEVVRLVARSGPTAPLRLATIFNDDDAVRSRLAEWHDRIEQVLDRVDGRAEWSVKVVAPAVEEPPPERPAAESGAEFLRRRKALADQRGQRVATADRVAEEVHLTLSRASVAARALPAQDPTLTGLTGVMALNGAYLVDDGEQSRFEEAVHELRSRFPDVAVEAAGPWPPYSFAVLDQS